MDLIQWPFLRAVRAVQGIRGLSYTGGSGANGLTLIDSLLAFSQVETLLSGSLRWEVSTSRSLCQKNILVSSANNINSSSLERLGDH